MEQETAQQMVQAIERMGSLSTLEALSMYAQIAMAIAAIILVFGLIWQWKTFALQRRALEASLFSDLSSRINQLEDKWSGDMADEEKERWYESLFSAFEYFSFFANHGYLTDEMKSYYKVGMKVYRERLENYPKLLDYYKELPVGALNEFKKFYKNTWGEEPF